MTFGEAYNFADKIADEIIGGTREMSETDLAELDKMIEQGNRWGKMTFADLYDTLDTLTARVAELEQENAKLLDEVEARRITDERTDKLLDELEAENKRLREALGQSNPFNHAYQVDDAIEHASYGLSRWKRTDDGMEGHEFGDWTPWYIVDARIKALTSELLDARKALANKAEIIGD